MKDTSDNQESKKTKKSGKSLKKEELTRILNKFIADQKTEQKQLDREKTKDFEVLSTIVSEYLKTFVIFGYGFDGQRVFISSAKTPQEQDALAEHLRIMATHIFGMSE